MPRKYNKYNKFDEDDPVFFKPVTKTITPRIPVKLHEQLLQEAKDYKISMNLLCIEKLQQPITQFSWEKHDQEKSEKGVQSIPPNSGTDADPQLGAAKQSG